MILLKLDFIIMTTFKIICSQVVKVILTDYTSIVKFESMLTVHGFVKAYQQLDAIIMNIGTFHLWKI